ncbi:MAG: hypothetical protein R2724_18485, partial [Bryobacterales bacterium]
DVDAEAADFGALEAVGFRSELVVARLDFRNAERAFRIGFRRERDAGIDVGGGDTSPRNERAGAILNEADNETSSRLGIRCVERKEKAAGDKQGLLQFGLKIHDIPQNSTREVAPIPRG